MKVVVRRTPKISSEVYAFKLDDRAQQLADEAKESSICVPIGEGENCW